MDDEGGARCGVAIDGDPSSSSSSFIEIVASPVNGQQQVVSAATQKKQSPSYSPATATRRSSSDQATAQLVSRTRLRGDSCGDVQQPTMMKSGEPLLKEVAEAAGTDGDFATRRQKSQTQRQKDRPRGHLRGTRSNGFASAPPFPSKGSSTYLTSRVRHPSMDEEDPWTVRLRERQKQQQMALIEQELDVMAKETQCGIGKWRPQWLQRCGNRFWMIIWLCWFCTVQGMIVNGLLPSSISTIERRFQFSTSTLGRIMQFYDFGYVIFCIPVSYFGGRHSKPLGISAGLLLMALGSLLFTMPHFIADPYTSSFHSSSTGLSKCHHPRSEGGDDVVGVGQDVIKNASSLVHSLIAETAANDSTLQPLFSSSTSSAEDLLLSLDGARFEASCQSPENQPGTFRFVFIFCLAHFLHGIGATPLFTIGVSYLDENVGPAISSLFIGVFYAFAILGPAFGFFASSQFLLWHTDWMNTGQKLQKLLLDLEETDPKWVGAWYMGFLLAAFLGLVAVLPLLILPKVLPKSLKWHRTRLREALGEKRRSPECCGVPASSSNKTTAVVALTDVVKQQQQQKPDQAIVFGAGSEKSTPGGAEPALQPMMIRIPRSPGLRSGPLLYQLWLDVRHIPIAIARILLNGPYMLITLGMAIDGLIVTGCSTFMSKYLERQFGVAPSKANLFIGAIMVPMAGLGTIFSGIIIHKYRMSCVRTLQYCVALVLCSLFLSPMYFIYCDHDKLVGIERHYPVDDALSSHFDAESQSYVYRLEAQCNSACQCNPSEYFPVCAELTDGSQMAFYSPCYAGCSRDYSPSIKNYDNCSCVPYGTKGGYRRVKRGFCESKCRGLFAFMILFAPFCFFTFAVGVALITVVLRTVDHEERSFALGIQWILVRVIGTIPAPMVFSWLFDFSCVRRHLDPCSLTEGGSCMLYHNKSLADLFLSFSVAGQLVALVCLISVLMFFVSSLRDEPLPAEAAAAPTNFPALDDDVLPAEAEPLSMKQRLLHFNPAKLLGGSTSPRSGSGASLLSGCIGSGGGARVMSSAAAKHHQPVSTELEPMLARLQPTKEEESCSSQPQPDEKPTTPPSITDHAKEGEQKTSAALEEICRGAGTGGGSVGRATGGRFLSDVV